MMEVIHDYRAGPTLFRHRNPTITQFATNILALRNTYNCDIIVMMWLLRRITFQDGQGHWLFRRPTGRVTQAVNDVVAPSPLFFFGSQFRQPERRHCGH